MELEWQIEAARRAELWLRVDLDLDTEPHDWTVEQWATVRDIIQRAVASMWQVSSIEKFGLPEIRKAYSSQH